MLRILLVLLGYGIAFPHPDLFAQPVSPNPDDVRVAMKKAATFYREKVASHGGYVYYYTPDLKERWGEGKADANTLFVQPPGTPTVGRAYLKAYAATNDKWYLDAARETALALVAGQLQSGGWTQTIHFGPAKRVGKYRSGKGGSWNVSSLDDDQTQAALEMLMETDAALNFKDAVIHEAAEYGLASLLKVQFPNGAFPQVWQKAAEAYPVVAAKFPGDNWKTEGRVKNYWDYYTLNDGLAGSVVRTLSSAHRIYKSKPALAAIQKLGDFLILAQMPDPQPAWCQQYNYEMVPIWARKFEPPAITAYESQDVMHALIAIARITGEKKYLEPIPKALKYLKTCVLKDGRVARFYEFKTNKPLYMNTRYELTYDDSDTPGHYGWKQPAHFDAIEKELQAAQKGTPVAPAKAVGDAGVLKIVKDLDSEGRWISIYDSERLVGQPKFAKGFQFISSSVFSENMNSLCEFLIQGKLQR